jgi:hypothetical protein
MHWRKQNIALRHFGAGNSSLRSPLTRATHDLLLPKPVREVILTAKRRESGECRLNSIHQAWLSNL